MGRIRTFKRLVFNVKGWLPEASDVSGGESQHGFRFSQPLQVIDREGVSFCVQPVDFGLPRLTAILFFHEDDSGVVAEFFEVVGKFFLGFLGGQIGFDIFFGFIEGSFAGR